MDAKHRESRRELDEARGERDEEAPAIGSTGSTSPEETLARPPRLLPDRRSRGGTGIGRDLDH